MVQQKGNKQQLLEIKQKQDAQDSLVVEILAEAIRKYKMKEVSYSVLS